MGVTAGRTAQHVQKDVTRTDECGRPVARVGAAGAGLRCDLAVRDARAACGGWDAGGDPVTVETWRVGR
ncbi:hypothetical protein GCM10009675_51370 [Prauserella alba]|uniref:Uncharacterized protein n=1 Tax=Prauserella alba TaxID=176898 RepID=A0ABP4GI02_9PSEU